MPLNTYRHGAGALLGRTFLQLTHVGRKNGQLHDVVAMVLCYDEAVICAGWRPETDWIRNLRASPAARVRLGRESFTPEHRFLSDDEAFDVVTWFRRQHPHPLRLISSILGWGDLRDDARVRRLVQTHPFVAFRPAASLRS
jgi:deazaflavin-dependent oxidoreductase (nitroreductase family)